MHPTFPFVTPSPAPTTMSTHPFSPSASLFLPGARFICTICFIFLTYFTLYVVCIYNVILLSYKGDLDLNGKEVNHRTEPEGCQNQDSAL